MHNHSSIWKNITMIIFYILLAILMLILFINYKVHILIKFNGTKSHIEIKFLKFCFIRKGEFCLKNRPKKNKNDNKINIKEKHNEKPYKKNNRDNVIVKIYQNNRKMFSILKKVNVERLYMYEEIGALTPVVTAFIVPALSTVTVTLVKNLKVNPENFYYKVIPIYTDLKFNLLLEADISFRIISVIFSIIKEKIAQINLKTRR